MTSLNLNLMLINPIQEAYMALLVAKKIQILIKYSDFSHFLIKKDFSLIKDNSFKLTCYQALRKSTTTL